jgi:hypothetical protein
MRTANMVAVGEAALPTGPNQRSSVRLGSGHTRSKDEWAILITNADITTIQNVNVWRIQAGVNVMAATIVTQLFLGAVVADPTKVTVGMTA